MTKKKTLSRPKSFPGGGITNHTIVRSIYLRKPPALPVCNSRWRVVLVLYCLVLSLRAEFFQFGLDGLDQWAAGVVGQ